MGISNDSVSTYPAAPADPGAIAIQAPPRGVIRKLRVLALTGGGAPSGFSYALYNSALAFAVDPTTGVVTMAADADLYRVTPDVAVASGLYVDPGGFGLDYAYSNLDGNAANRPALLYLIVAGLGTVHPVGVALAVDKPTSL